MHIAEGFLPPLHAAAWTAVAVPFVIHGSRQLTRTVREHPESKLLLAGAGAFTFVMSALKMPSVTGSSSHPTGTGVGTIIFRPPVMAVLCLIVLLFQALLLAHGGLTTLGANLISMGVAGPWAGYLVYKLLAPAAFSVRVFFTMAVANLTTYVVTSTQLALAFPEGGFLEAWGRFLGVFAVTQIPLALVEGFVGVALFVGLRNWAGPQLERLNVFGTRKEATTHA